MSKEQQQKAETGIGHSVIRGFSKRLTAGQWSAGGNCYLIARITLVLCRHSVFTDFPDRRLLCSSLEIPSDCFPFISNLYPSQACNTSFAIGNATPGCAVFDLSCSLLSFLP